MGCLALVSSLFHCGPVGVRSGEDRLLARRRLSDGDTLYIIAHRSKSWAEPYEVRLFRLHQKTNCYVNFLAFEDSYWWGCRFAETETNGRVKIYVYGMEVAAYSLNDGSVSWAEPGTPNKSSFLIDGVEITYPPIPQIIKDEMKNEMKN